MLQVHAGGHFHQFQSLRRQRKNAALGHVHHRMAPQRRVAAAERAVFHLPHELDAVGLVQDPELSCLDSDLQAAGAEGSDEHNLLRVLADVDEAARPGQLAPEPADVHVSFAVGLREPQEREVQAPAVVQVELVRLIDHRLRVGGRAEIQSSGGNSADHSRLGRQRDQIDDPLLGGDLGDALGHADAQIHQAVGPQLQGGAAGDDLALAHRHRADRGGRNADLAGEGRVVGHGKGLPVVFRPCLHDAIDQHAGNLHLTRIERTALGQPLDLHDHDPARIAHCGRDRQRLQRQRFLFHRHIAVGIGGRAADDAHIDRERPVQQAFLAVNRDQLDQVFGRARIELSAAEARIDKRAQPDARQVRGPVRSDIAIQMRDHALRQVVGLDLVGDRQPLQRRHQAPVPADHAPHQSLMPEMVQAAQLAVTLAGRIHQRQVARLAAGRGMAIIARQVQLLERDCNRLGEADADEAAGGDRVAVADQAHRVGGADDLAVVRGAQLGQKRVAAEHVLPHPSTCAINFVYLTGTERTSDGRAASTASRCVSKMCAATPRCSSASASFMRMNPLVV